MARLRVPYSSACGYSPRSKWTSPMLLVTTAAQPAFTDLLEDAQGLFVVPQRLVVVGEHGVDLADVVQRPRGAAGDRRPRSTGPAPSGTTRAHPGIPRAPCRILPEHVPRQSACSAASPRRFADAQALARRFQRAGQLALQVEHLGRAAERLTDLLFGPGAPRHGLGGPECAERPWEVGVQPWPSRPGPGAPARPRPTRTPAVAWSCRRSASGRRRRRSASASASLCSAWAATGQARATIRASASIRVNTGSRRARTRPSRTDVRSAGRAAAPGWPAAGARPCRPRPGRARDGTPVISSVVLADSTFHWLTTRACDPATKNAHIVPTIPSPGAMRPRPVSQADRTTRSASRPQARDLPGLEQPVRGRSPDPARARRVNRAGSSRRGRRGWPGAGCGDAALPP